MQENAVWCSVIRGGSNQKCRYIGRLSCSVKGGYSRRGWLVPVSAGAHITYRVGQGSCSAGTWA
jgi:hypothetical protein